MLKGILATVEVAWPPQQPSPDLMQLQLRYTLNTLYLIYLLAYANHDSKLANELIMTIQRWFKTIYQ